jgi:tartrate-resistant acid phosphatase type 5
MTLWRSTGMTVALFAVTAACCTCSKSPDFAVRAPFGAAPAHLDGPPLLRVLHFADFGDPGRQQEAVATAMIAAHGRAPFDLAFSAGDNVYECGIDVTLPGASSCAFATGGNTVAVDYVPPVDERVSTKFERALQQLVRSPRPLPIYSVLGNHDVTAASSGGPCQPVTCAAR